MGHDHDHGSHAKKDRRRPGPVAKLHARIRAHENARVLEALFWGIPGVVLIVIGLLGYGEPLNEAIALLLVLVGLCLIGWGLIPPVAPPPKPKATSSLRQKQK